MLVDCQIRTFGYAQYLRWQQISLVLATCVAGCQFERDNVGPGYYGAAQAGDTPRGSTTGALAQGGAGMISSGANPPPTSMMNTNVVAGGTPASSTGTGPANPVGSGAPSSAGMSASAAGGNAASAAGMLATSPAAGAGGVGTSGQAGTGAPAQMPASKCDLSGRWLSTVHYVTDALGALQYAHAYLYYEIAQQGDTFMVTKGLHCGDDAVGGGDLAATVDFTKAWPSCMSKVNYVGRTGSSMETANGCSVSFAKWYVVRGATLPYYLDPANKLPAAEDKATDTKPGWEDWDGDGNPGLTGNISGAVVGKIFVAPRSWTQMTGTVPDVSSSFKLPLMWDQQQNVMSYDGSPFLATEAVRASNASLHFTGFARLTAEQAAGDDAAICKSIVALAPKLTAEAAGM